MKKSIKKILTNRLYRDIVKFFHANPASIDSPRGISTWIKAERSDVKKALGELAKAGVLIEHKGTSTAGYSYTRDTGILREIGKLLKKER